MKYLIFFAFSFVLFENSSAEKNNENAEVVLLKLKSFDLDSIPQIIDEIDNEQLKTALEYQYLNLVYKDSVSLFLLSESLDGDFFKSSIVYFSHADYLKKTEQDSLAFKYYLKSYEMAKKSRSQKLLNMSLNKLNFFLLKGNEIDLGLFSNYIKKYQKVAKDSIDIFWSKYLESMQIFQFKSRSNEAVSEIDFLRINELENLIPNNAYLSGKFFQLKGMVYSNFTKDYDSAIKNYEKALVFFNRIKYDFVQEHIFSSNYNIANAKFRAKRFKHAIKDYLKAKKSKWYKKNSYIHLNLNSWLYKSYDSLSQVDSALFYFKKVNSIKEKQKRLEHAQVIKDIDAKYNLNEKQNAIDRLDKEKTTIQNKFFTLLPVLGIVIIISIIIFFLYKRYKNKSTVLQEEKSETLQKLDELKSIVIKNHIILKDKTKVYISDLMYVKSDDHYLNIFTSDDKSHFVRGKLSNIREELPPNFIQCHRSYIINSNFIKRVNNDSITLINKTQIPLSRSYRDKF